MKEKQITQAYLIENGYCTKTTISRICRNSNDKGMSYSPTPRIIMTLALAFKLTQNKLKSCLTLHFRNVKIDGEQLMDKPEGFVEVEFENLEVLAYEMRGNVQISAKATGISLA